jgi:hypothetical protein
MQDLGDHLRSLRNSTAVDGANDQASKVGTSRMVALPRCTFLLTPIQTGNGKLRGRNELALLPAGFLASEALQP